MSVNTGMLPAATMVVIILATNTIATAQIDGDVTEKTRVLYANLKKIQNGESFLFGQEFFNSFRFSSGSVHTDETFSDSKSVTGAHPALLGSDFHYYLEKNATERAAHTDAVKWAYQQGYAITFDWHLSARGTTSYEYTPAVASLVNNIVNNASDNRAWFYGELDKVVSILNNDLVVDGEKIPVIFRPLHEMNGGWFWWGSNATSPENYKALYRLLVDYVKERTTTVLFCWSPNTPTNMNYYPGNDYVDVLGLDAYEVTATSLRSNLAPIVDHAQANDKVAVLSETGNRVNSDNASTYWKNTVLPAIMDDPSGKARKIAWVLTWINASWSFPYVPHSGSGSAAKQSFIDFKNSPAVLFGDEISNMYVPLPDVPVSIERHKHGEHDVKVSTVSDGVIGIELKGFGDDCQVRIRDVMGRELLDTKVINSEEHTDLRSGVAPGILIVQARDGKRMTSIKFFTPSPILSVKLTR